MFLDSPVVVHVLPPRCRCCGIEVMCNRKSPHSCNAPLMCASCWDAEWAREEATYDAAWIAENSDEDT